MTVKYQNIINTITEPTYICAATCYWSSSSRSCQRLAKLTDMGENYHVAMYED